jgi:hypothetical protein
MNQDVCVCVCIYLVFVFTAIVNRRLASRGADGVLQLAALPT